mmetsp:Transcript_29311/g.44155  ORF Transcript_29311/g.44155 Transcript_29311/m.44155 type:complete len:85 (+) Transcript_29311:530-784(+)
MLWTRPVKIKMSSPQSSPRQLEAAVNNLKGVLKHQRKNPRLSTAATSHKKSEASSKFVGQFGTESIRNRPLRKMLKNKTHQEVP